MDYKDRDGKNIPLDLFFEHGTKDHWIEPKEKKALHWIDTGGSAAKAIYSQGDNLTDGVSRFSKGHYVSGIKSLHIIEDTVKANKEELQREFTKEMLKWKQQILPEIVNPERAS